MKNKYIKPLWIIVGITLAAVATLFLLNKYYSEKEQLLEGNVATKTREVEVYRKMLKTQSQATQIAQTTDAKTKRSPKLVFVDVKELSNNDLLSHTNCSDVSTEFIANGKFDKFINDKRNTKIEKCIDNFSGNKIVFYSVKEYGDIALFREYQNGSTNQIFYSRDWNLVSVDCNLIASRSVQGVPGNEVAAGTEDFISCSKTPNTSKSDRLLFISSIGYGMGGRSGIVRCSKMFGYCTAEELINALTAFGLVCKDSSYSCNY